MVLFGAYLTTYTTSADRLINLINNQKFLHSYAYGIEVGTPAFDSLVTWIDWRSANRDKITVRVESGCCSVFSNDLSLLETLTAITNNIEFTEAVVTEDPTVITLNNPKHKFRVYLKGKVPSADFFEEIGNFLSLHDKLLYPCKALKSRIKHQISNLHFKRPRYYSQWLSSSYFIEYDDEATYTLLKLYFHNVFAKNYKVVMR
jgi:hypothetical protein